MQIIKVPGINGLNKTKGCEKAGNAIIAMLKEVYSSEQGKPIDPQVLDLEEIHLDNDDLEYTHELIYKNSLDAYEEKPKVVFLGGDHSISFPTCKAFLKYCQDNKKEPCLIVFDAHPDLMTPMKEPTHEEWLRALIEEGFPSENILLVGIRNSYKDELSYMEKKKIKVMNIDNVLVNIEDACDTIMEFASGKELYVSIDIDVVDPVYAPATGYKNEVGGLTSRQLLYLLKRINKIKKLKAIDLVEINAEEDKKYNGMTIKLGAKILGEFL